MLVGAILGFLQGIFEWLPVSSQGVIAAVYGFMLDRPLAEAVSYALWLHIGTSVSVLVMFRGEIAGIIRQFLNSPTRPTRLLTYLVVSTVVSGAVGFPLLLMLGEISEQIGAAAMGIIGAMMLVTGGLQLRSRVEGTRDREELSLGDALLAGVAQGFAVLPGLSRSGLTVAALLSRRIDRREALVLSFLMSVPVTVGAGLYVSLDGGMFSSDGALIALAVAAVVGLATIKGLLVVAERVNFAAFVIIAGVAILGGAVWQAFQ